MLQNKGWCKFYSLSNEYHFDAIANGFWYSTPPQYFNDIADCNSELLDYKYVFKEYETFIKRQTGIDRETQRSIAIDENAKLINYCLGITCFTPFENVKNHLMWAHYAENHKGICLHFKDVIPQNQLCFLKFKNGLPPMPYELIQNFSSVNYKKNFSSVKSLDKLFTIKSNCWKYEREKRLIQITPPFKALSDGQRKIYFDKSIVSSIIIGKQFLTNENYQAMLRVIKTQYPQALLFQISLKSKDFRLSLNPIEIYIEDNMFRIKEVDIEV